MLQTCLFKTDLKALQKLYKTLHNCTKFHTNLYNFAKHYKSSTKLHNIIQTFIYKTLQDFTQLYTTLQDFAILCNTLQYFYKTIQNSKTVYKAFPTVYKTHYNFKKESTQICKTLQTITKLYRTFTNLYKTLSKQLLQYLYKAIAHHFTMLYNMST